ncbi:MAG: ATP synthase F1 subunit epsilon [Bdellovibrionaceae bacterium]|nr:ATP synthase F1 subunit epsilon [Pseudobdellovibrionaceae bacterium]MBX3033637.1 ATP synthase F1 subunit epsilon [Pseudobdellovibrionaceae bacterium]
MFKLTVVTPERRLVLNQEIDEVTVPGFRGELNILPGHAPLITTLETGIMRWKIKGQAQEQVAVLSWGYCEVHPDGVEILADMADLPEEVDVQESQQALNLAEKRLLNESLDEENWKQVQREVARRRADLDIAKHKRV